MWPSASTGPARLLPGTGATRLAPAAWGALASAAAVLAFSAFSHTDWAMARGATLRQQCSFVATMLAVGLRLWFADRGDEHDQGAQLTS